MTLVCSPLDQGGGHAGTLYRSGLTLKSPLPWAKDPFRAGWSKRENTARVAHSPQQGTRAEGQLTHALRFLHRTLRALRILSVCPTFQIVVKVYFSESAHRTHLR